MRPETPAVRLRLNKADKLVVKAQFDRVRALGVKAAGPALVVVKAPAETFQSAVICGRKFSTLAVRRNRVRRLLWESIRLLKPNIAPCWLILIPRRRLSNYSRLQATEELAALLRRHGVLRDVPAPGSSPEC